MSDTPETGHTVTSEQPHVHVCPICLDAWSHPNAECEELTCGGGARVDGYLRPRTWATCPTHEGYDE
jgi:hypothetical protein